MIIILYFFFLVKVFKKILRKRLFFDKILLRIGSVKVDAIIFIVLLVIVICFFRRFSNVVFFVAIFDIFLRILTFAILYNDEEFFDGIYKIMKYKIQIDKLGYFKEVKKNDTYGRKQLKSLITFMQKIPMKFDNKNVFELERIEKYVKLKSYVNN